MFSFKSKANEMPFDTRCNIMMKLHVFLNEHILVLFFVYSAPFLPVQNNKLFGYRKCIFLLHGHSSLVHFKHYKKIKLCILL